MSDRSAIEWTDATWNPVRGRTKVRPGCKFCYAEVFAERFVAYRDIPLSTALICASYREAGTPAALETAAQDLRQLDERSVS